MLTCKRCWNYQTPRVILPAYVFYDLIATHTRGLSSLGKPKHAYGDLLVQIILGKLPSEVIRDLTREHGSTAWDIDQLMVAILKEIRILEASSHSNTSGITPEHVTSTAAFHLGSKASHSNKQQQNVKNRKKPCIFCKGHHAAAVCDIVCDTEKRYELVKTQNLCFNCLAPHKVSQCSSKDRCKVCNKKKSHQPVQKWLSS